MTIYMHETWTDETDQFPEDFNWSLCTSVQVQRAVENILMAIRIDLKTEERSQVPGLRTALRLIAQRVDCL